MKVDLPDSDFQRKLQADQVTPDERRAYMKKMGVITPAQINPSETPILITSTGAIFEPFTPKETESGSFLSKEKLKEKTLGKGKTFRATRKIRRFDDDWDPRVFAEQTSVEVYTKAHKALSEKREKELHEYVTEHAYPQMVHQLEGKTIYWEYIKALEPPQVVQVRTEEVLQKNNMFSQVTLRFHTQQILSVYDRFGRLIHGHPNVAKDVLEYVVMEKHLSSLYGKWRLHGKIIPEWLSATRTPSWLTQVMPDIEAFESSSPSEGTANLREEAEEAEDGIIYDQYGKKVKT